MCVTGFDMSIEKPPKPARPAEKKKPEQMTATPVSELPAKLSLQGAGELPVQVILSRRIAPVTKGDSSSGSSSFSYSSSGSSSCSSASDGATDKKTVEVEEHTHTHTHKYAYPKRKGRKPANRLNAGYYRTPEGKYLKEVTPAEAVVNEVLAAAKFKVKGGNRIINDDCKSTLTGGCTKCECDSCKQKQKKIQEQQDKKKKQKGKKDKGKKEKKEKKDKEKKESEDKKEENTGGWGDDNKNDSGGWGDDNNKKDSGGGGDSWGNGGDTGGGGGDSWGNDNAAGNNSGGGGDAGGGNNSWGAADAGNTGGGGGWGSGDGAADAGGGWGDTNNNTTKDAGWGDKPDKKDDSKEQTQKKDASKKKDKKAKGKENQEGGGDDNQSEKEHGRSKSKANKNNELQTRRPQVHHTGHHHHHHGDPSIENYLRRGIIVEEMSTSSQDGAASSLYDTVYSPVDGDFPILDLTRNPGCTCPGGSIRSGQTCASCWLRAQAPSHFVQGADGAWYTPVGRGSRVHAGSREFFTGTDGRLYRRISPSGNHIRRPRGQDGADDGSAPRNRKYDNPAEARSSGSSASSFTVRDFGQDPQSGVRSGGKVKLKPLFRKVYDKCCRTFANDRGQPECLIGHTNGKALYDVSICRKNGCIVEWVFPSKKRKTRPPIPKSNVTKEPACTKHGKTKACDEQKAHFYDVQIDGSGSNASMNANSSNFTMTSVSSEDSISKRARLLRLIHTPR